MLLMKKLSKKERKVKLVSFQSDINNVKTKPQEVKNKVTAKVS
jgi:hypothetical protein